MSLTSAISSAISGMQAQSSVLSMVSNNIANSETTGYKTTYGSFEALLNGSSSESSYGGAGVTVSARSNIGLSGSLVTSTSATNLAIDGDGFFPVTSSTDGTTINYTRSGEFTLNTDGQLVNNGYYLVGWPTDADGNIEGGSTQGNLEVIDTDAISSYAEATTTETISANLPANAAVGDTFESSLELYDSLGTASTATLTWAKTAENTWTATVSNPVSSSDATTSIGTVTSSAITVTFNTDGTLASTSPSPATLTITGWKTGAADSSITLDMGTADTASGLSQYSSDAETLSVSATITPNGAAYGTMTGVKVDTDGSVNATYSNGKSISIYKIPVATFANTNGLKGVTGSVYASSRSSGTATLNVAGTEGAGKIDGFMLESSTTDTNEEFSTMISAQHAYSAASQVMSAANTMFDTLINMMR